MKKAVVLTIIMLLVSSVASAQLFKPRDKKPAKTEYQTGTVPLENHRVVFRERIEVPGLSTQQIIERAKAWHAKRFVEPTVISSKIIEKESSNIFESKNEEYIVFNKKFFVLNRARIYYYITITALDGICEITMSRISYWHDDESPDGGIHYQAEELITDENALDKGRLKKNPGRFRTKTIDLKNTLFKELKQTLTLNQ